MKKQILIITLALMTGVSLNSCKKGCTDDTADNYDSKAKKDDDSCEYSDHESPMITINEPSLSMYLMDTTSMQATIPISVDVSDNEGLHQVVITLTNVTDGTEALHIHLHPDATTASVDTSYVATVMHKDYTLTVTAEDHNENTATEEANTHVHME